MLRSANLTRGRQTKPMRINDVCPLKDDSLPRVRWVLVRILESHSGRDDLVRTYTVRFENGTVSKRAVQLLCPLEVNQEEEETTKENKACKLKCDFMYSILL